MKAICVDLETTVTLIDAKKKKFDLSPFNSNNKLVSVGWCYIESGRISPTEYLFFNHKDLNGSINLLNNKKKLQEALYSADVFVAHNAKFDAMWLLECGFDIPKKVHCTMVREYVLNRGINADLSLHGCAITNQISPKRKDLIQPFLDQGLMFNEIPYKIVQEYGEADVQSCAELYEAQEIIYNLPENQTLIKTRDMSCEFTEVLIEIERNGIMIDKAELEKVGNEFSKEKAEKEVRIKELIAEVMGDTPINLNSPEQLSTVIYSRKPKSKDQWASAFNIGLNAQNKPLFRPKMDKKQFKDTVVRLCDTVYRTKAEQCSPCLGKGFFFKTKKNGENFKKATRCSNCGGTGIIYTSTGVIAGFKMQPTGVLDCASGGFNTDKDTLSELILKAKDAGNTKAVEFLELYIRVSALDTYINSFVNGIKRGMQNDGLLHAKFNQTIAATGRLSSTDPNLQNQPRGNTFPIRRVFISRWASEKGILCETDFSQLEFRCAGHLARDKQVLKDIQDGKDIHNQTSKILTDAGQPTNRQDAKPHTFKPLYGGLSGTTAETTYYKSFLDIYADIRQWHTDLQEEAIANKKIRLPTGREYAFPYVKRNYYGNASQKTQIVNYPVQGFATGDIVPIALIYLLREYRKRQLKSKLCLTVHDSVAIDVHPTEIEIVKEINKKLHKMAEQALEEYYGITMYIPLDSETKIGPNLIDMKKV